MAEGLYYLLLPQPGFGIAEKVKVWRPTHESDGRKALVLRQHQGEEPGGDRRSLRHRRGDEPIKAPGRMGAVSEEIRPRRRDVRHGTHLTKVSRGLGRCNFACHPLGSATTTSSGVTLNDGQTRRFPLPAARQPSSVRPGAALGQRAAIDSGLHSAC